MASYLGYTATYLEVRMDVAQPKDVAVRLWIDWGLADSQGRETDTIFGGCLDIDTVYPSDHYHIVVGRWLRHMAQQWVSGTGGDDAFIFDAVGSIMEVLGDAKS